MEFLTDLWWSFRTIVVDPIFHCLGYERIAPEPDTNGLVVYNPIDERWVHITKIIVPTQFDKDQILLGFKYLHDLGSIDTDIMAVNTIVHVYENPDLIVCEYDPYDDC